MNSKKTIFYSESGKGYTNDDINSLLDYYDRTGIYPNEFTENDWTNIQHRFGTNKGFSSSRYLNR